ncbi:MAG TPA: DinB family protein [Terriglobales bacterium]|jgi:uncharacterized damage-inducible protein DinB|nr:DinB family protein [Terriglobales bacterium]
MSTAVAPSTDFATGFREMLLDDYTRKEMPTTKAVIDAIPESRKEYRPDPKARSAGQLAWHLANSEVWFLKGIADLQFPDPTAFEKDTPKTIAEISQWYETNAKKELERLRKLSPEQLATPVDFFGAFKMPAFAYLLFQSRHSCHHRGQLASYLRPMGSKCPDIYGGSYDFPWKG